MQYERIITSVEQATFVAIFRELERRHPGRRFCPDIGHSDRYGWTAQVVVRHKHSTERVALHVGYSREREGVVVALALSVGVAKELMLATGAASSPDIAAAYVRGIRGSSTGEEDR